MPIFGRKKSTSKKKDKSRGADESRSSEVSTATAIPVTDKPSKGILRSLTSTAHNNETSSHRKFVFNCQLAHGSPIGRIQGFENIKDLYRLIAAEFGIPDSSIIFCTLNTHKIDMGKLLGGQIGLDDLIYAHIKGQSKELELVKSETSLGLTITDNGAGNSFIKKIKEGSIADQFKQLIKEGDHIEKINGQSVVGMRHFEVAATLKNISLGSKLQLRLVEPQAFDFPFSSTRTNPKTVNNIKSGTKTLRFKSDGQVAIEEVDDVKSKTIDRINDLLEKFMGINDSDLAHQIWELAQNQSNPSDFATAIDNSEIGAFNFSDDFIFDLWALVGDVKVGRVPKDEVFSERL